MGYLRGWFISIKLKAQRLKVNDSWIRTWKAILPKLSNYGGIIVQQGDMSRKKRSAI